MLLHNANINVAIAVILHAENSLRPSGAEIQKSTLAPGGDYGRGSLGSVVEIRNVYIGDSVSVWLHTP